MLVGTHGSSKQNIEQILKLGLLPGKGQHHWAGPGAYFFQICKDASRDAERAAEAAKHHAERKFGKDVRVVAYKISTTHFLDLQYPGAPDALQQITTITKKRAASLGFKLEENWQWVRPEAHFFISVFLLTLEQLSGSPVDVVRVQFGAQRTSTIEPLLNPEICVRRPRALVGAPLPLDCADDFQIQETSREEHPSAHMLRAVGQVSAFVERLDDQSFIDLIFKAAEGSAFLWHNQNRLRAGRPTLILSGNHRYSQHLREIWDGLPTLSSPSTINIAELASSCGPEETRKIESIVSRTSSPALAEASAGARRRANGPPRAALPLDKNIIFAIYQK